MVEPHNHVRRSRQHHTQSFEEHGPRSSRERMVDPIDTTLARALAHPVRARMLMFLRDHGPVSPVQFSKEWDIPIGTVGYHMRRLAELGIVQLAERVQRRGAIEHRYTLVPDALDGRLLPELCLDAPALGVSRNDVGAALRQFREARGVTSRQLARAAGLRAEYLAAIEGGRANPRIQTLIDLAAHLDASLSEVLR
jgi:DNA-binding transcriptional ArsR family regulator